MNPSFMLFNNGYPPLVPFKQNILSSGLQDVLPGELFWNTFLFYIFYFILFDILPVYLPDGQPTNGWAIFDVIWHEERSDFLKKRSEANNPTRLIKMKVKTETRDTRKLKTRP